MPRRRNVLTIGAVAAVAIAIPATTLSARTATHAYVASKLQVPATTSEASAFGRDINGDGHPDNALGAFFAALALSGVDAPGATQSAVTDGDLLMLGSLRTRSLVRDKKATWQVLFAKATHPPDFSGAGSFTVDPVAQRSTRLRATIKKHHLTTALGSIPVEVSFGAGVVGFSLQKAEVTATCTRSGCSKGRITGVITHNDIENVLLPQLAGQFTAILQRDCPTALTCADATEGKALESLFDKNADDQITASELQQNSLLKAVLASDIRKPAGVSAGFGFNAVKAKIVG